MKHRHHIPMFFQVGGQRIDVNHVERCSDHTSMATASLAASEVQIAEYCCTDTKQNQESKTNSYYHELIHLILNSMGRNDLSNDEVFVCSFAGFLTEAMVTAEFEEIRTDMNKEMEDRIQALIGRD